MPQYVEMLPEGCNLHSAGSKILGKSGGLLEDDCLTKKNTTRIKPATKEKPSGCALELFWMSGGKNNSALCAFRLDGRHVVFGSVTAGLDVVKKVESYGSRSGRTSKTISITDCGELP